MATAHILTPLRDRAVARLWCALAFSALGDQLYVVALGFVAADTFGAAAGYLAAARPAVILVATCFGGALIDRWPLRRGMISADLVRALALALLVAAWLVSRAPSAVLLAVLIAVLATGESVFEPAMQALIPTLVPERRLLVATNGLFDATDRLARLLGPGLVALAATVVPIAHFFSFDAVTFLVSALAVASLRETGAARPPIAPVRGMLRAGLARGVAALRSQPILSYALDIKSLTNGIWYIVFLLVVPLAILDRGLAAPGGPAFAGYGLVIASYGISNLAANLVVGSLAIPERPAARVILGVFTTGFGIVLMGVACMLPLPQTLRLPALAAAACISGFGGPLQDITLATLRQTLIPTGAIAAATRVQLIATSTGTLVAMLAAPSLIGGLGPVAVMGLAGIAYLGCAALGWLRPTVRASRSDGRPIAPRG